MTDADGAASFRTVFPGWYSGRAVHIHVKVNLGGAESFTGQLFFDGSTLEAVYADEPYAARVAGRRRQRERRDLRGEPGRDGRRRGPFDGAASGAVTLGVRAA